MTPFENHYEVIYHQMEGELLTIREESESSQQEADKSIPIIRSYLQHVKENVLSSSLTPDEEVLFFKHIKPKFYRLLIYYFKVFQIELGKPAAGKKALIEYFGWQLTKLGHFFKKYDYLFRYLRAGSTASDHVFFKRGNLDLLPGVAAYGVDTDPSFTTGYDFIVAKIGANELLQVYIETELQKVERLEHAADKKEEQSILWTGSKAALIELLYALQGTGVLNNGAVALNEVAHFIEGIFGIKLGNYYRVFQEIRVRKKNRTQFLDELRERLLQKMDFADDHPQGL